MNLSIIIPVNGKIRHDISFFSNVFKYEVLVFEPDTFTPSLGDFCDRNGYYHICSDSINDNRYFDNVLKIASGEILAFIDGDMKVSKNWVDEVCFTHYNNSWCQYLCGPIRIKTKKDLKEAASEKWPKSLVKEIQLVYNGEIKSVEPIQYFTNSNMSVKKSRFEKKILQIGHIGILPQLSPGLFVLENNIFSERVQAFYES